MKNKNIITSSQNQLYNLFRGNFKENTKEDILLNNFASIENVFFVNTSNDAARVRLSINDVVLIPNVEIEGNSILSVNMQESVSKQDIISLFSSIDGVNCSINIKIYN